MLNGLKGGVWGRTYFRCIFNNKDLKKYILLEIKLTRFLLTQLFFNQAFTIKLCNNILQTLLQASFPKPSFSF